MEGRQRGRTAGNGLKDYQMLGAIRISTYDVDMTAIGYVCAMNMVLHMANLYEHDVLSKPVMQFDSFRPPRL